MMREQFRPGTRCLDQKRTARSRLISMVETTVTITFIIDSVEPLQSVVDKIRHPDFIFTGALM